MGAAGYFYLALLVLVLIPVVILPWEGRTPPDWLYALLAITGLSAAAAHQGWGGFALSGAAGIGCLVLATCAVALLRDRTHARILTGGQIKLLAAGATWSGVIGAAAMVAFVAFALFLLAACHRSGAISRRPDASAIVAVAIVTVAMQHYLPGM